MRRVFAERIFQAIQDFPDSSTDGLMRNISYMPSFYEGVAYVFLQLRVNTVMRAKPDYREKRQVILEVACGAAKNKFPLLKNIVGIAIDAPKFTTENSEDFLLMPCEEWPDEMRIHYETANEGWEFFRSPGLKEFRGKVTEFVSPPRTSTRAHRAKVGRNDPCSCGSGIKYKKCCGRS